jgi:hypothetical protein
LITRWFGAAAFGTLTTGFFESAGGTFGVLTVALVEPADGASCTPGAFELPQAASAAAHSTTDGTMRTREVIDGVPG